MTKVQKDYIGQKFNKLTIVSFHGYKTFPGGKTVSIYKCMCECGNEAFFRTSVLKNGNVKSCGCTKRPYYRYFKNKYGVYYTKIYTVYVNMMARCYKPDNKAYNNYGGRGITVCELWKNSFYEFYEWCLVNGWKSGLEIDRKDNELHYDPDNCHFVTRYENSLNKRTTRLYEYHGLKMVLKDWAVKLNIGRQCLRFRIEKRGWSIERAFTTPARLCKAK